MPTRVITWPAPASEAPSPAYTVSVNGVPVFVYGARVRSTIDPIDGLWTHKADCAAEQAAFAIFDCDGPVEVTVRPARPFITAAVLPACPSTVEGGAVRFTLDAPRHLTVLLDDSDQTPLHLFISTPETDIPDPADPHVRYFGPGVHEISTLTLRDGETLYLAGGAVVYAALPPGFAGTYSEQWKVTFYLGEVLTLHNVTGVTVRGRGILDASRIPHPGFPMLSLRGARDVALSGITLRDAANWNVIIHSSAHVTVEDLRIISGRLNSDGINSVNAQHVTIRRCFVRNHDDSFAVKTLEPAPPAEDITVEDCVVWNDWGYALGPTYETRAAITGVHYRRCAILFARHWCLGIHVSDSATLRDIGFHDIDIYAPTRTTGDPAGATLTADPQLLHMTIGADVWGKDPERGRIRDVTVERVTLHHDRFYASELSGADADHDIRGLTLRDIRLAGQPPATDLDALHLRLNAFVTDLTVTEG